MEVTLENVTKALCFIDTFFLNPERNQIFDNGEVLEITYIIEYPDVKGQTAAYMASNTGSYIQSAKIQHLVNAIIPNLIISEARNGRSKNPVSYSDVYSPVIPAKRCGPFNVSKQISNHEKIALKVMLINLIKESGLDTSILSQ